MMFIVANSKHSNSLRYDPMTDTKIIYKHVKEALIHAAKLKALNYLSSCKYGGVHRQYNL